MPDQQWYQKEVEGKWYKVQASSPEEAISKIETARGKPSPAATAYDQYMASGAPLMEKRERPSGIQDAFDVLVKSPAQAFARLSAPNVIASFFQKKGLYPASLPRPLGMPSPEEAKAMAISFIPEAVEGGETMQELPRTVGDLRRAAAEKVQPTVSRLAGAGPERTTEPMMEDYKAERAKTEQANREAVEKHAMGIREAARKQVEQQAEYTLSREEAAEANAQEARRVQEINEAATQEQGRRSELAQSMKRGSQQLGEGIKDLAAKVKAQDDANYTAIRQKLANDPGVPMADVARDARTAEGLIKGSTENIKQFRELIRKAPETEGIQTSAGFVVPGDPLYEMLQAQGALDTGGNLPFDQLQGYSSEIGMKLSKGGLPGDVYQALKYLKGKLDGYKAQVAERNGIGEELRNADRFHFNYMDTFYDKPSAVAASLDRVGKLDPQFYAEPFVTGKAAETGIDKLQRYSPELANLATSLRTMNGEFVKLPKQLKVATPRLKAEPEPPSPIERPQRPELKPTPKKPTVEDVRQKKIGELKKESREIGRLNRWDASIMAASAVGPFLGRWETLLIDPAILVVRKGLGKALDDPRIYNWLAEPSAEDIRILNGLPPEAKATFRANLSQYISRQRALGRRPAIAPPVSALLGPQMAQNRRDALQALGR